MYKIVQEQVFPFIKGLHGDEESAYSKYMADAIFKIPTPQLLEQIVTAMDEIDWKDSDIRGDLYEYLLSKIATAGTNGQFRTPRHIIRMMVDLVTPNPEDVICDPACGTSGFLVAAGEYLREHFRDQVLFDPVGELGKKSAWSLGAFQMADVSLLVISRMDLHLRLRRPGKGGPAARPYAVTVGDSAGMRGTGFHRPCADPVQSNSTKTLDPNGVGDSRREARPGRPSPCGQYPGN